ncbi:glutaminyl-peptide cyclotransferase [Seiridium cupressi]
MGWTDHSRRWLLARLLILLVCLALFPTTARAYSTVSDSTLQNIPSTGGDFDIASGSLLAPVLIPRVPGTPGSAAARQHFVEFFSKHLPDWRTEWCNSSSKTPATGDREIPFSSLVFTRDPPWAQSGDVGRLTLAAHYDSLYRPEGFIGAIDSAAPCAVLLHVARSIDAALTKKWEHMEQSGDAGSGLEEDKGVQIVLLDGEEAWEVWSSTDSLYGARALAEAWDSQLYPAMSTYRTPIKAINLFLLLDLLGGSDPNVPSYFENTHWAYEGMARIEARMRKLGLLQSTPIKPFLPESRKVPNQFARGYIEDDHIPFLVRGVPILHIIPNPFPTVWHTMNDDGEHLDIVTLDDWAKIVTGFVAEWMELDGFMDSPKQALSQKDGDTDAPTRDRTELTPELDRQLLLTDCVPTYEITAKHLVTYFRDRFQGPTKLTSAPNSVNTGPEQQANWYQAKLAARPLLTQSITTAVLFATGDITAQQLVEKKGLEKHELARTGRMFLYGGAIFGPAATTWFKFLQRKVVLKNKNAEIVARVACDQGLFAPTFIGIFLSSMAVMEGGSPQEKLQKSYLPALQTNYLIWPFVQLVNFKFVPLHHRVLFVNFISIGWNCYLSFLNSTA